MKRRREFEIFSMSFLDAICCGFGAMILLFLLIRVSEPQRLEQAERDLDGLIAQYEQELNEILGETERVRRQEINTTENLQADRTRIEDLQAQLERIRAQVFAVEDPTLETEQNRLAAARQTLTEEMRRLLADYRPPIEDYKVGGIPVDSEYIIFLIDTSGSMQQFQWDRVQAQLRETLEVYPTVKGIQVMNDEGTYMFPGFRGKWIPDTPSQRRTVVDRLRTWNAFSNSSPIEGIVEAIRTYYSRDKKISLYVFGDEFTGSSIDSVVKGVDVINRDDDQGERRVRIHAIGFPVRPDAPQYTSIRFATLMRILCAKNGGTFVGLHDPERRGPQFRIGQSEPAIDPSAPTAPSAPALKAVAPPRSS